jgi:hypothetical protein
VVALALSSLRLLIVLFCCLLVIVAAVVALVGGAAVAPNQRLRFCRRNKNKK